MKITIDIDPTSDGKSPALAARDVSLLQGGAPVPSNQLVSTDSLTLAGNSGVTPLSVAVPVIAAARVLSTGALETGASVGVAGVNHSATGTYIVTLTNPNVGAVALVTCHVGNGPPGAIRNSDGTITVSTVNTSNAAADAAFHLIVVRA